MYTIFFRFRRTKNIQDTINKKLNINLEDNKKFLDETSSFKKSQLYNSFMEILMNPLIKFFDFKTLPIQLFLMMLLQIKLHIACTNTNHICDIEKWDFEYSSLLWSDADKIRLIYNTAGAINNNNIIKENDLHVFYNDTKENEDMFYSILTELEKYKQAKIYFDNFSKEVKTNSILQHTIHFCLTIPNSPWKESREVLQIIEEKINEIILIDLEDVITEQRMLKEHHDLL